MSTTPVNSPPPLMAVAGHVGHADAARALISTLPFSTVYVRTVTAGAGAAASRSTPGHIPLGVAHHAGGHLHERALALRAYRLELLASNIANVDTPGYKAVDIDVEGALRSGVGPADVAVKYHVPHQSSLDGNTVEMDVERAKFSDEAIRYQFSIDRAINHYMHIADLLKTLKD